MRFAAGKCLYTTSSSSSAYFPLAEYFSVTLHSCAIKDDVATSTSSAKACVRPETKDVESCR